MPAYNERPCAPQFGRLSACVCVCLCLYQFEFCSCYADRALGLVNNSIKFRFNLVFGCVLACELALQALVDV